MCVYQLFCFVSFQFQFALMHGLACFPVPLTILSPEQQPQEPRDSPQTRRKRAPPGGGTETVRAVNGIGGNGGIGNSTKQKVLNMCLAVMMYVLLYVHLRAQQSHL